MLFLFEIICLIGIAVGDDQPVGIDQCPSLQDEYFSYFGANGLDHWGEISEACNGKSQSPVNVTRRITTSGIKQQDLGFVNYDKPITGTVENVAFTVQIRPNDGITRSVHLDDITYNLERIEFCFGVDADSGTEHVINGFRYALEVDLVHKSTASDDQMLTITLLYSEEGDGNDRIDGILSAVDRVQYYGDKADTDDNIQLQNVFDTYCTGSDVTDGGFAEFFVYSGSLTVPPCTENVIYLIYYDHPKISTDQMEIFRKQFATKEGAEEPCMMYGNIRPIQPPNGRKGDDLESTCNIESE